jgi:group I intron endonuclease
MQVYLLENSINGKYYVGKTVNKNLKRYLSNKRHGARNGYITSPLVAAMREFGDEIFTHQVLALGQTDEQICELEKLWIIALDARNHEVGYNVQPGGNVGHVPKPRGPMSEETKRKIGLANKGRQPKGYIRTELHRQQRRDAMKGNTKGVKITTEIAKEWKKKETLEQKKTRHAAIKASWDRLTPEQRAERVIKMHAHGEDF